MAEREIDILELTPREKEREERLVARERIDESGAESRGGHPRWRRRGRDLKHEAEVALSRAMSLRV